MIGALFRKSEFALENIFLKHFAFVKRNIKIGWVSSNGEREEERDRERETPHNLSVSSWKVHKQCDGSYQEVHWEIFRNPVTQLLNHW